MPTRYRPTFTPQLRKGSVSLPRVSPHPALSGFARRDSGVIGIRLREDGIILAGESRFIPWPDVRRHAASYTRAVTARARLNGIAGAV